MTHPLTDKLCQDIIHSKDCSKYRAEYTHYFLLEYMRAAYDLGESKGRADMLNEVIEWLQHRRTTDD